MWFLPKNSLWPQPCVTLINSEYSHFMLFCHDVPEEVVSSSPVKEGGA